MGSSAALLNLVVFFPLLLAVVVAVTPRSMSRGIAVIGSWLNFLISLGLLSVFDASKNADFQLRTIVQWIPQFGVQYKVGIDGIGLVLVLLTTLLSAVATMSSWTAITHRVKEYYVFILL